jgi:hypothetical protein
MAAVFKIKGYKLDQSLPLVNVGVQVLDFQTNFLNDK